MPRRPTPDPLMEASAFVDEAQRARGDWRRALLHNARSKVDDAHAALADGERALRGQRTSVVHLMVKHLELRRQEIARLAARIDEIEEASRCGNR
ncbi:MAG: hypothetical protein JWM53_5778 [bacterium]|nr:hypothetical protein [bacterium]